MLTKAWTKLRPHPTQDALWRCPTRFAAVVAGRGSGKTELSRRRIVRYLAVKKPWANPIYFYALPTRDQAKRVAWEHIKSLVPPHWIKKDGISETELSISTVYGSKLYVVGMDKPQRIEGDQWDGCVIDESSDQRPKSFDLSVLPALSHRRGWCWRIGVPKRFGIGAADFKKFYDSAKTDKDISAFHWESEDILIGDQLRFAKERLAERDYNEQYKASWESIAGQIFYSFHEDNIKRNIQYDPDARLYIGNDFNVDPMCWVYGHIYGGTLYIFDELVLRNSNTQEALDVTYSNFQNHRGGFTFIGDASSRQRKTSASFSDYAQIQNDQRFDKPDFPPVEILYPDANPSKIDRFAATNARLRNANSEVRLYINYTCKRLIDDLTSRGYKPGTREPDDHGDMGHMSDALGYIIHYLWPPSYETELEEGKVFIGKS